MKLRASLATLIFLILVVGDQIIKYLVKTGMSLGERIHVTDWFYILFTENHAWPRHGFHRHGRLVHIPCGRHRFVHGYAGQTDSSRRSVGLCGLFDVDLAGAFGNIIDNFFYGLCFTESQPYTLGAAPAHCVPMGEGYGSFLHGRVVDMFYFPFFTWPDWVPVLGGPAPFSAPSSIWRTPPSRLGRAAMLLFYYKYLSVLMGGKKTTEPSPEITTEEEEKQAR